MENLEAPQDGTRYGDIIDQCRVEHSARIANLKAGRGALDAAKYSDVSSDGEDIFNCCIDDMVKGVDDLINAFK